MSAKNSQEFREHLKRIGFKKGGDIRRNKGKPFEKGHPYLRKSYKVSEETKKKLSISHLGKETWNKGKAKRKNCKNCNIVFTGQNKVFCSLNCRIKFMRGKNSHSWKGGKTSFRTNLMSSEKYKNWRRKILTRDNFTCQVCNQVGGELQVHHIKPFSQYSELRFDINNGITLCKECHKKTDSFLVNTKKTHWNMEGIRNGIKSI